MVLDCIASSACRGMCGVHYARWNRRGATDLLPVRTPSERFWEKVNKTETCWLWTASVDSDGYGQWGPPPGKSRKSHRFAYEELNGPVPDGLQLDHLCRNRACVNPSHLDPVTCRENLARSPLPNNRLVSAAAITHCPSGHDYTPENTYRYKGFRHCRTCRHNADRIRRMVT